MTKEERWARVPREQKHLDFGALCRHRVRAGVGKLDGFLPCDLGGLTDEKTWRIILLDEGDVLVFLTGFDPILRNAPTTRIDYSGYGVFLTKHGVLRGSFYDVEVSVP